jgi:hypothetical protein
MKMVGVAAMLWAEANRVSRLTTSAAPPSATQLWNFAASSAGTLSASSLSLARAFAAVKNRWFSKMRSWKLQNASSL